MLACTYFMLLFSQFNSDPVARYNSGYFYIGLVLLNVGLLLIVVLASSLIEVKIACRKRYVKKIKKEKMKNRNASSISPVVVD